MQPKTGRKHLTKRWVIPLAVILIVVTVSSAVLAANFSGGTSKREFYVGVEVAYGNFDDLKAVVDETKSYTNLVVFGLPEFTKNLTLLNMGCDYVYNSGLHFIVLLTNTSQYTASGWENITPAQWAVEAKQKYGDKFLAVYRWDEPGGDQLDHSKYQEVKNASSYSDAATQYVNVLREPVQYYKNVGTTVVTADYGLYWFDYKVGYDAVLGEFGWNNSREQQIAQVRGAARANSKDWGAIVTWEYSNFTNSPFIESGPALYNNLVLAYNSGAKYAVVFDYPQIPSAQYGILGQEHLDALKNFWNYVASNVPADADYRNVKTAYVLPIDYGFGFRSPVDSVWGLWSSNSTTQQIYSDVQGLITQRGANFDIVCDYPTLLADAKGRYDTLIYWNGTQTTP